MSSVKVMICFIQLSVRQKEIRMMRVDEITEGSRMKWFENRSNIESAQSEVYRTRIWFDVATEKKEYTKKRITRAQTA